MKKLGWVWLLLGLGCGAQGQGTVNFYAGATVASQIATNAAWGGGPSTGYINGPPGSYYFGLFVAPSTVTNCSGLDPTQSGFTFTGAIGTNTSLGRFSGNSTSYGTPITGFATSSTASFVVVGWSGNLGPNWPQALVAWNSRFEGFWGVSAVGQVQLGGGAIPPGNIFGLGSGQIPGFTLEGGVPGAGFGVTVDTSPPGLSFTINGGAYSTPQAFTWWSGGNLSLGTTSPQTGGSGEQYTWRSWSDGGAMSHTVSPTSSASYTANFSIQYFLAMSAGSGGTVSPGDMWVDAGAPVVLSATPNPGFCFTGWSGSGAGAYSGTNNPASITMTGPLSETANFAAIPQLEVARQGDYLLLMWATNDPALKLAYATSLTATTWVPAPVTPGIVVDRYLVITSLSDRFRVYRLQK